MVLRIFPAMTSKIRVGYVPEHFSLPLLQLAETEWGKQNITLVAQPSGTGQMLTSFHGDSPKDRTIDIAVALTEALIAGIAKGRNDYKLVGTYVKSSLNWAVITGTDEKASKYQSIEDLKGTTLGISRIGSGSQIMASVMALQHNWKGDEAPKFKVNDTFANLRAGVNQKAGYESSAFMWEWFTTKPYVDSGEVRFIGNVPTPWPSWTIAMSNEVQPRDVVQEFQLRLQESIKSFSAAEETSIAAIEKVFSYKPEDIQKWWENVRWVQDQRAALANADSMKGQDSSTTTVSRQVLQQTLSVLEQAGVVTPPNGGWKDDAFVESSHLID